MEEEEEEREEEEEKEKEEEEEEEPQQKQIPPQISKQSQLEKTVFVDKKFKNRFTIEGVIGMHYLLA